MYYPTLLGCLAMLSLVRVRCIHDEVWDAWMQTQMQDAVWDAECRVRCMDAEWDPWIQSEIHGYRMSPGCWLCLSLGSACWSHSQSGPVPMTGRMVSGSPKSTFFFFMSCNPKGRATICPPYPYIKSIQIAILVKLLGSHAPTCTAHVDQGHEYISLDELGHVVPTLVARVVGHLDRYISMTWKLDVGSQGTTAETTKTMFSPQVEKKNSLAKARFVYCIAPCPWYHLSTLCQMLSNTQQPTYVM